jgi:hypothetical protein
VKTRGLVRLTVVHTAEAAEDAVQLGQQALAQRTRSIARSAIRGMTFRCMGLIVARPKIRRQIRSAMWTG